MRRIVRRARTQVLIQWLGTSLLIAAGVGIVASGLVLLIPFVFNQSYIVWGSIAIALLVSAFAYAIARIDTIKILSSVDSRLGLKARLITAYDLNKGGSDNPFRNVIEEEAEHLAGSIVPKEAYPYSVPKTFRLFPVLGIVLMVLYLISLVGLRRSPDPTAVQTGQLLESVGKTLAVRSEEESLSESERIAEEMQKLGRMLRRQRLNRSETEARLSALTSRIQDQIEGISREMLPETDRASDAAEGTEDTQTSPEARGAKPTDSEDMMMGRLTDEEAQVLEQLEQELEDPKGAERTDSEGKPKLENLLNREKHGRELRALQSADQAMREALRSFREGSDDATAEKLGSVDGSGKAISNETETPGDRRADDLETTSGSGEGQSSNSRSPGREAVEDQKGDDFERSEEGTASLLGELDGEITNDSRSLQAVVRNLPVESTSLLPKESLILEYSKAVEEAITQENIPIAMRNYIRDYFLKIGIKTADGED